MLDNKRQWNDISQELEVFLVESTEPFVEWLKKEIDREFPCRHFTTLGPASGSSINTVRVICTPMYALLSGMYVHVFCSCFVTV